MVYPFKNPCFRSSSSVSTSGTSAFLLFYLLDPDPLRGSSLMSPLMRIRNTAISQYTYSDPDPIYTLFSGMTRERKSGHLKKWKSRSKIWILKLDRNFAWDQKGGIPNLSDLRKITLSWNWAWKEVPLSGGRSFGLKNLLHLIHLHQRSFSNDRSQSYRQARSLSIT